MTPCPTAQPCDEDTNSIPVSSLVSKSGDAGVPHRGPVQLEEDDGDAVTAVPAGDAVLAVEAEELGVVADGAVVAGVEEAWPPAGTVVDAVAHPARPAATAATRRSRARMHLRRRLRHSGWGH
jgi:hypothetical protein